MGYLIVTIVICYQIPRWNHHEIASSRQGVPYETAEQLLTRLPERLRTPADLILGSKMHEGDVAYAVAVLIDRIEHAPGDARSRWR